MSAATPGNPAQQHGILLRRLIDSRQWDRALEVARDWLSQDPESPDAHLAAAQALVNLHQYPQAETHIKKVLSVRLNYGFALRLASIAAFHQNKTNDADEHIRRAVELQPNDAMHWYHLAWMRYRQGLLEAAEQYGERALALQPDNADTINLIANCHRGNPLGQKEQYLRALELDPENGIIHNNLGTYYLNTERDYAAAEASYRRALQCDPANLTAQQNLFIVLRLRDPVYRVLTWPRTLLRSISWTRRDRSTFGRIAALVLCLLMGRYFLIVFGVWLMLVWPIVKTYEYLTLSDIRAKAGVVGARRGGWRGFHKWPLALRLSIFVLLVLSFWGGLFWCYESGILDEDTIIGSVGATLLIWYSLVIFGWWKRARKRMSAKRAEKKFRRRSAQAAPS